MPRNRLVNVIVKIIIFLAILGLLISMIPYFFVTGV